MPHLSWLRPRAQTGDELYPSVPAPRSGEMSFTRVLALPATESRWLLAVVHTELTLSTWGIPTHYARRWLQQAQPAMDRPGALELTLALDPKDALLSMELADEAGDRQFGIDAYLNGLD